MYVFLYIYLLRIGEKVQLSEIYIFELLIKIQLSLFGSKKYVVYMVIGP